MPLTFPRQLARVLVLAIQTNGDSSPRATTGDEAHVPAKTGVGNAGARKTATMKIGAAPRVLIIVFFRNAATDQY
jgi:hypothetical protein